MNYGKICVLLAAVMPAVFAFTNYCDTNLCGRGKKHIACGNDKEIASLCPAPIIVPMTKRYRNQIVRKHNAMRNKIAIGLNHFPPAKRMATMRWDSELAYLAELNVKQCQMRHDQCRNVPRFSSVGQNLSIRSWNNLNFTVSGVISSQIKEWFREYIFCPRSVIRSYTYSKELPYSRFTAMVQDKSTHIGCAVLRSSSGDLVHQIIACNYAFANVLGTPIYSAGQTASLCTTGTDDKFTGLCSRREKYS